MLLILGTIIFALLWPTNAQAVGKYTHDAGRYWVFVDIDEEKKMHLTLSCSGGKTFEAGPYNLTATRGYQEYMIDYDGSQDIPSVLFDKIRKLCPDVLLFDSDLRTVTHTSGDTLSIMLESMPVTVARMGLPLEANTYQFSRGSMNVYIIIDEYRKATFTVKCGRYTVKAEFRPARNYVSRPYLSYDFSNEVGKESIEKFKERVSYKCSIPLHERDLSHLVVASPKTLFSELHWRRISLTANCGKDDVKEELATSPGNSFHGFFAYVPDAAQINAYKDAVGKFCGTSLSSLDLTSFAFVTEKSVLSELYGEFITLTANTVSS
ncbi:hypothetical protein FOZ61_001215 [Perkinsus olseni]|uniref:Uncharacterized protein n=1 Tax=Perkinsus olseni TaxID=32597 RepID=A0A7J6LV22_PEROL|nr:hypothetical protein FOL46_004907 [Perkinsus olseni]KAF4663973.1 hypothetical protein FOZ61_001215 [Perkinsus olseni]